MMIALVSTIIGIGVIPMCSWIAEAENDFFISPDEKSMQGVILNAQSNNHRTLIILIVNVKEALKGR
jgi:hypothetical protein